MSQDGGRGDGSEGGGRGADREDDAEGGLGGLAGGAADALGGVADLLGDGDDTREAREALRTASEVAEGVRGAAEAANTASDAARALQRGNVGAAAGAVGNAVGAGSGGVGALTGAAANALGPEAGRAMREASRVANAAGQVARGVGQIVEGAGDLLGGLFEQRQPVHFDLQIADEDAHLTVRHVSLHEQLDQLCEGYIEVTYGLEQALDERELLSRDVTLRIERGEEHRYYRGIVRHARIRRMNEHHQLQLDVVPALWLASETLDSRVYQDVSVPDLVERVVRELFGTRQRTVKSELTQEYSPHEYLVQHRESHFAFLSRLLREEGIFFYFDHEEENAEHEVLVLADSNTNRPRVRQSHDGVIEYEQQEERREGREVAFSVERHHRVGATDAVVHGYDWTNPALNVHHERTDRADWTGPKLEVYDHHHAVRHHGYDDGPGSYQSHTADRRSKLHTERLDLARSQHSVATTVVTAQPGHAFELRGTDDDDGSFVIVSMTSTGEAGEHGGTYTNALRVIPSDVPYRPPQPERPVMPGPETAIVVGPPGEEIHTDQHGRVKVQFHWDRQGQRNEHSSAWIRVMQTWSGPGWGFNFIPRIGMEVVVQFLGGDPDRPLVTGCVYNGSNRPPYTLPDEKTKSTIKTNSSPTNGGYNELRFEDKAGSEEVYLQAQKDFNELVKNNHSTRVRNCQTNDVDVDQKETIGRDQVMTVDQNRTKHVKGDEKTTIGPDSGNRTEIVHGDEEITVHKDRRHYVLQNDRLTVTQHRTIGVLNGQTTTILNGHRVTIGGDRNSDVAQNDSISVANTYHLKARNIIAESGPADFIQLLQGGENIWQGSGLIGLRVGGSYVVLRPEGVRIGGPHIKIKSDGVVEIEGSVVKINTP